MNDERSSNSLGCSPSRRASVACTTQSCALFSADRPHPSRPTPRRAACCQPRDQTRLPANTQAQRATKGGEQLLPTRVRASFSANSTLRISSAQAAHSLLAKPTQLQSQASLHLWADDVEHDADHHSEEVGAGGDQADRASDPAHHVEEAEDALRALIVLRQIASRRQEQEQSAEMRSNGAVK